MANDDTGANKYEAVEEKFGLKETEISISFGEATETHSSCKDLKDEVDERIERFLICISVRVLDRSLGLTRRTKIVE